LGAGAGYLGYCDSDFSAGDPGPKDGGDSLPAPNSNYLSTSSSVTIVFLLNGLGGAA